MDYWKQYVEYISQEILTILSTQPTSVGEMIHYLNGPSHNKNTKIKINEIEKILDHLSNEGHEIHSIINAKGVEVFFHIPYETYNKDSENSISFGLISDTHWGANKCDIESLNRYYEIINERGIETVFHCGDLISGINMYENHDEDNSLKTLDEQCLDLIENYPNIKGQTVFIIGNHDCISLIESEGEKERIDAGVKIEDMAFESGRDDLVYLGACVGRVVIDKLGNVLELTHDINKQDYEYITQDQKDYIILNDHTNHLKIIAEGHFHKTRYYLEKNNGDSIHQFGCGTFLKPSESYLKRGLYTPISGWIVNITYDDKGGMTLLPEPIYFE
ncbi:MAG: metallophosphoesterase family protein [Candidatus Aenigmarchaeota archaeon]|nr:metallophosphoesterase family protein [Candidatus Aenigmarchaeota archaeon]